MRHIVVPDLPRTYRLLDLLLWPVMYGLSGFSKRDVQETHPWHTFRNFGPTDIDVALSAHIKGTDPSKATHANAFLFHAPILKGWTHCAVVSARGAQSGKLYFGWIVRDTVTGELIDYGISRKSVSDGSVRLLVGSPVQDNRFFAVDNTGNQVPVTISSTCRIGDGRYDTLHLL